MPLFCVSGTAQKDIFGSVTNIATLSTVMYAVDEAQAIGQTIINLKKQRSEEDGWTNYRVTALLLDIKWLQDLINYEHSIQTVKVNPKPAGTA